MSFYKIIHHEIGNIADYGRARTAIIDAMLALSAYQAVGALPEGGIGAVVEAQGKRAECGAAGEGYFRAVVQLPQRA